MVSIEKNRAIQYVRQQFVHSNIHNISEISSEKAGIYTGYFEDGARQKEKYGVESRAEASFGHILTRDGQNADIRIYGSVHRAEEKDYSADFIGYHTWERKFDQIGNVRFIASITADGATPLVPTKYLFNEIYDATSYTQGRIKGFIRRVAKPDIFWRMVTSAIFGGNGPSLTPLPREWESAFQNIYRDYAISEWLISHIEDSFEAAISYNFYSFSRNQSYFKAKELGKDILLELNKRTRNWYERSFQTYSKDNYNLFPYGVAGISVAAIPTTVEGYNKLRQNGFLEDNELSGVAVTGDISVGSSSKYREIVPLNSPYQVDEHDDMRMAFMQSILSPEISELLVKAGFHNTDMDLLLRLASGYMRNPMLGCFPVPERFDSWFEKSIRTYDANFDPNYHPNTLMYTDGAKIKNEQTLNKTRLWEQYVGVDWIPEISTGDYGPQYSVPVLDNNALALLTDPELFVYEQRLQYAEGGYDKYGRGDDLAWLFWRVEYENNRTLWNERTIHLLDKMINDRPARRLSKAWKLYD